MGTLTCFVVVFYRDDSSLLEKHKIVFFVVYEPRKMAGIGREGTPISGSIELRNTWREVSGML